MLKLKNIWIEISESLIKTSKWTEAWRHFDFSFRKDRNSVAFTFYKIQIDSLLTAIIIFWARSSCTELCEGVISLATFLFGYLKWTNQITTTEYCFQKEDSSNKSNLKCTCHSQATCGNEHLNAKERCL